MTRHKVVLFVSCMEYIQKISVYKLYLLHIVMNGPLIENFNTYIYIHVFLFLYKIIY